MRKIWAYRQKKKVWLSTLVVEVIVTAYSESGVPAGCLALGRRRDGQLNKRHPVVGPSTQPTPGGERGVKRQNPQRPPGARRHLRHGRPSWSCSSLPDTCCPCGLQMEAVAVENSPGKYMRPWGNKHTVSCEAVTVLFNSFPIHGNFCFLYYFAICCML